MDPHLTLPSLSDAEIARVWARVGPANENGCRDFMRRPTTGGYGQISIRGRMYPAHRLVFLLSGGILTPERALVCHRCNRPICVEPTHLYADDHAGNARYMSECGRAGAQAHPERLARGDRNAARSHPEWLARGERQGLAKLTPRLVVAIRTRYAEGGVSQANLATQFGVRQSQIWNVLHRRTWAHVT